MLIKAGASITDELMTNISPIQSRQLQILSGPNLLAFFPDIEGKKILLLGEVHTSRKMCYSKICQKKVNDCYIYRIHEWLYHLSLIAPQCLDIFIEHNYLYEHFLPDFDKPVIIKITPGGTKSPLEAIRYAFGPCYTSIAEKKSKCISDKLRYHYIDVRTYDDPDKVSFMSPLAHLWHVHKYKSFNASETDTKHYEHRYKYIHTYLVMIVQKILSNTMTIILLIYSRQ